MKQSFLYMMRCGGFVKIGHATKPQRRLKEVRAGNPAEVTLEYVVECQTGAVSLLEGLVHDQLSKFRHRGEWFAATNNDAQAALDRVHALYERAIAAWGNAEMTASEVAAEVGIDLRTLHARLGPRKNFNPSINTSHIKKWAIPRDLAEMRWYDPATYPDKQAIADACQVSVRTLYNQFGARDPALADKRKRMNP